MEAAIADWRRLPSGAVESYPLFCRGLILFPHKRKRACEDPLQNQRKRLHTLRPSGFLCIVVSMTFYTLSVSFLDAHVAGILFCSNTFFSMILAHFFTSEISRRTFIPGAPFLRGLSYFNNPLHFKGSFLGVIIISISPPTFSSTP